MMPNTLFTVTFSLKIKIENNINIALLRPFKMGRYFDTSYFFNKDKYI